MGSKNIILTSSTPLQNKLTKLKKAYLFEVILICIGSIITPLLIFGILSLIVTYIIDYILTGAYRNELRGLKFQCNNMVSSDSLFTNLQCQLISKYGEKMLIDFVDKQSEWYFDAQTALKYEVANALYKGNIV